MAVLIVAVALALPVTSAAAAASPAGDVTAAAPKKKAKKCKRGKVRVKVGKRVSCLSVKKALPKPKAGDPRLLAAQSVYGADWSKLRNRRGKRAQSLPKLIRKLGPRAPALLNKATTRGLARVDALRARAASAAGPHARPAAAGCESVPRGARRSDSFTSNGGDGTRATVTSTLGSEGAGMVMELSGNGFSVKLDMDLGFCEPNEVEAPSCPTAVGKLEGKIRYKLRVVVEVSKDGEDVWSQAIDVQRKTTLEGWTDNDAKLDRLDVEDVETSNFRLGGSIRGYPPISIRTRIVRKTQVDMRSGAYEPDASDVNVSVDTAGLGGPDRADVEDDIAQRSRAEADRQFRAIVDKAIGGYRTREDRWQQVNTCAALRFSPASNTRTLEPGEAGGFGATAIASADGGSSELDAKLSNPTNATFSPTRAGGQQARFGYTVSSAVVGGKVSVTVHATSKAGVAEDSWEQPIEPPFEIDQIAGNFNGSNTILVAGSPGTFSWTGGATFARQAGDVPGAFGGYTLETGSVNFTASGRWIGGDVLCDMSGSEFVSLPQGSSLLGVTPVGQNIFAQGPHDYGVTVTVPFGPMITVTLSNCVEGAEEHNGQTRTWPVPITVLDTGPTQPQSPDGIHYNGSYSNTGTPGVSFEYGWTLTGSKRN